MRLRARRSKDYKRIQKFPCVQVLKKGVLDAFMLIRHLALTTRGSADLTPPQRSAATVAMVGALATNGYLGRKKDRGETSYTPLTTTFSDWQYVCLVRCAFVFVCVCACACVCVCVRA